MTLPTVDELVAALDHKRHADIEAAKPRLFADNEKEALVPGFVQAFPRIRNAPGRTSILFWLTPFARRYPEVVDLALMGLRDTAYPVRMRACSVLAYSLRSDAIPHLESLLSHRDRKTQEDARAAVDAIKHQNHHYWFDRSHSGRAFWEVNPEDGRHG